MSDALTCEDVGCPCVDGPRQELPEAPPAEGWRIRDLDELNRVLGRMARIDRIRGENEHIVAAEVNRLGEWLEKEDEALEKRYRDLEAHVYEFARDNRETLGKTRRLPNGVVAWRERKEGAYRLDPKMTDHAARKALLEWAKKQETHRALVVRGPEQPNLDEIKAFLVSFHKEQDPLAPPGLEWVEPGESLSIVVKEKP